MGKIEEKKFPERQTLIQLQNIKDWTGMTLGIMMSEIRNLKKKGKDCVPIANCRCHLDEWMVLYI